MRAGSLVCGASRSDSCSSSTCAPSTRPHHRPGVVVVEVPAERRVEALELGGVAAQHDAEQPRQHPQLGELAGGRVLPPVEDLAGHPADLPVVGHLGEQRAVEVVGVAEVVAEPVGQRVAVEGTHGGRLLVRLGRLRGRRTSPTGLGAGRPGVGVDDATASVVAALVAAVVPSGVVAGVVPGTTSTTGVEVALTCGVGAALAGVADAGREVVAPLGRGSPCGLPPTAQAMPAEPTSAATPSTMTMPWRRGALCRPIVRVFHRRAQHLPRGSMGG